MRDGIGDPECLYVHTAVRLGELLPGVKGKDGVCDEYADLVSTGFLESL